MNLADVVLRAPIRAWHRYYRNTCCRVFDVTLSLVIVYRRVVAALEVMANFRETIRMSDPM